MKKQSTVIAAAALVILSAACNDNKKSTETVAKVDTVAVPVMANTQPTVPVMLPAEQVPDTIRTGFTAKYPKATTPQWYSYTALPEDEMPMDVTYYYVDFMNTGDDMRVWYNNRGEWVKTSTRMKGDSRLPDAVNKTLNDRYLGYKIDELKKENDKDMDMYEIKLLKGDDKVKLKILPNGTIFKRK